MNATMRCYEYVAEMADLLYCTTDQKLCSALNPIATRTDLVPGRRLICCDVPALLLDHPTRRADAWICDLMMKEGPFGLYFAEVAVACRCACVLILNRDQRAYPTTVHEQLKALRQVGIGLIDGQREDALQQAHDQLCRLMVKVEMAKPDSMYGRIFWGMKRLQRCDALLAA